jgi:hypothetical protein
LKEYEPSAAVVVEVTRLQPEPVSASRRTWLPGFPPVTTPENVAVPPYVGVAGVTPKVIPVAADAVLGLARSKASTNRPRRTQRNLPDGPGVS